MQDKTQIKEQFVIELNSAIIQEKAFLENLIRTAQVIVMVLDTDGRIVTINPYMERLSGFSLEEVKGKDWFDTFLPERDRDRIRKLFLNTIDNIQTHGNVNPIVTKDGVELEIEWYDKTLKNAEGYTIGLLSIGHDITERKQKEGALRDINAQLNTLIEAIPDAVYVKDSQCRYLLVNKAVEELTGLKKEEIIGKTGKQLLPRDLYEQCRRSDEEAIRRKSICIEEQMSDENGKKIFYKTVKIPLLDDMGNIRGLVGISRNITDRKLSEEKLLSYQKQLRSLASELSLVEERERRRISTSLHDNIGQTLALSYIKLGALQEMASSPSLSKSFEEVRELIEQAIQYTKTLTSDISPPILYELGFEAAVEWLGEQIQNQYGIVFNFQDDKQPKPLNDEIRVTLFQAVRELFINITKHAQAQNAKVFIQRESNEIRVIIEDNGVGFDISRINPHLCRTNCFGLFNIRERLNHIGGKLKIESEIGSGTHVTLKAPLKSEGKKR